MSRRDRRREKAKKKAGGRAAVPPPGFDANAVFQSAVADQKAGRFDVAEAAYRQLLAFMPDSAAINSNLAVVLRLLGKLDDALVCCRRAVKTDPNLAQGHSTMGAVLMDMGLPEEAVPAHQKAISIDPGLAAAHMNLAVAFKELDRLDEAKMACEKGLALAPGQAEAHNTLGSILQASGQNDAARASYQRSLEINPAEPDALTNMGALSALEGHFEDAADSYRRALEADPNYVKAQSNLGAALVRLGRHGEAVEAYEQALAKQPEFAEARVNLGNALRDLGNWEEAEAAYRRALESDPDNAEGHLGLSVVLLLNGRLEEGWAEYEWRWKIEFMAGSWRGFQAPVWDGSPLEGRKILVWWEQGVGDELMFSTCLPDLIETAKPSECILECDSRLTGLFERAYPEVNVMGKLPDADARRDDAYPPFDVHISIGGLARLLRGGLDKFPDQVRRMTADPERAALWRSRFDEISPNPKIGIAWRGGGMTHVREMRSIAVEFMKPLLAVDGVDFINLQYGDRADDLAAMQRETGVTVHDWPDVDPLTNLEGQAAQIACLDLVIQTSNASAHLAGSLGVPVWNIIPFAPDFRWFLGSERTPWYPPMRLFRQPGPGDWRSVVQQVAGALEQWRGER